MKILRLDLIAYGPFSDVSLDLSGGSEGLHLIYGPNEAGKSTTLRALRALLYGIPRQCEDNHKHAYGDLRIGAALRLTTGPTNGSKRAEAEQIEVIRRKAVKSLFDGSDTRAIDESVLKQALGGIDSEDAFAARFGIDHAQLLAGGRAIDQGQGDLGELLFAASAGIAHLGKVHAGLDEQANELFNARGRKPRINVAIASLAQQRKLTTELAQSDTEWRRAQDRIAELAGHKSKLTAALLDADADRERLRRFAAALPLVSPRATVQAALEALGTVRVLPGDFAERRRNAQTQCSLAVRQIAQANEELARLEKELVGLAGADDLLAYSADIEGLQREVGSYIKAAADRVTLAAELAQSDGRIATIASGLGYASADAVPQTDVATRTRIGELAEEYPALVAQRDAAERSLAEAVKKLEGVLAELAGLPASTDCDALAKVVKRAETLVAVESQWPARQLALQTESEQAGVDAVRLAGSIATLARVETMAVPSDAALDAAEQQLTAAQTKLDQAAERLREAHAQQEKLAEKLRADPAVANAPSPEQLAAARGSRNESWRQLRDAISGNDLSGAATATESLKLRIHEADDLADALLATADSAGRRSEYARQQAANVELIAQRTEQLAAARESMNAAEGAWQTLWQESGIAPRSVREMKQWLVEQRRLCNEAARLRTQSAAVAHDRERIDAAREMLCEALAAPSMNTAAQQDSLAELVRRGEEVLASEGRTRAARAACEKQVAPLQREIAAHETQLTKMRDDLQIWQADWKNAAAALRGGEALSPKQAQSVVRELIELQKVADSRRVCADRIQGIDRDAIALAERLAALLKRAAPDLAAMEPGAVDRASIEATARELVKREREARGREQSRSAIDQQCQRQRRELKSAQRDAQAADTLLAALCQEAGTDDAGALVDLESRSAEYLRLRTKLGDLESQLAANSGGASLEEFVAQLVDANADTIAAEAAAADRRISELGEERDSVLGEIAREDVEAKRRFGGHDAAALAGADEASVKAEIEEDVARFAQLRLASVVLGRAIDRYRLAHQAPLLARAGELFQTLTARAFDRLDVEYDDTNPVVVGIRAGGKQRIRTTAMSDGTRDQLYLAMRIASVEQYLESHEPIPFIVDDVLQQFDDGRALAALQAFAELSRKTQVIFFTHHEHLLRLAAEQLPTEVCFTQRLDEKRNPRPKMS